mmetsp:Transcript_22483/g.69639  ORF Transcript_22483/g.69639 Transcript_22483/m.69639 type:complete len:363 (-) Transcript_22483:402-1490(-)
MLPQTHTHGVRERRGVGVARSEAPPGSEASLLDGQYHDNDGIGDAADGAGEDDGDANAKGSDRRAAERFNTALYRVCVSVAAACAFGVFTFFLKGQQAGLAYFAAYLVEQSLSVDNLFVFLMLFAYFKVPMAHQGRVLTWGIVGAVLMRGFMIAVGVAAVENFRWMILVFAAVLIYSSVKMLQEEEEEEDLSQNYIIRMSKKVIGHVSDRYDGDKFFTDQNGERVATPLLLCLISIELSDFVFAVDSIPAVLGVSHDPFIVYTSNIFAIIALRSLYTLVARAVSELPYLKHAVALVLLFIGVKMILEFGGFEVGTGTSLFVVFVLLVGGVVLSMISRWQEKQRKKDAGGRRKSRTEDVDALV